MNYYMKRADRSHESRLMTLEDASDIQLLSLARAGEETAFATLYRRWQGGLYRFSLRMTSSASIAEDVTQEVFLSLMNGTAHFDPALGTFSSYVYGIARNHVLRRVSRERIFAPILECPEEEPRGPYAASTLASDPIGDIVRREQIEALHRAIGSLPLRYREVVVLCELQELGYAEAARVIGCPEGTIRSRLHRARILLLDKLTRRAAEGARTPGIEPARCVP